MKRTFLKAIVVGAGIAAIGTAGVRADVLYQDTTNQTGINLTGFDNNQQIGQEIWLGSVLPEYLTNFSFEYYSPDSSWSDTVYADVRLFENNGPLTASGYATPGTLFYDSGPVAVPNPIQYNGDSASNGLVATYLLSDLQFPTAGGTALNSNFVLPTNFTFTVAFSGLTGAESVALPMFDPPTVGTNYNDYWYDASGTWELLTNANIPELGFAAEFNGSPTPTPEPTVFALGALGGAMLAAFARRRQRRGQ